MTPSRPSSSTNDPTTLAELQALLRREAVEEKDELERTWHLAGQAQAASLEAPHLTEAVAAFEKALHTTSGQPARVSRDPVRRLRTFTRRRMALATLTILGAALAWFLLTPVHLAAPLGTTATATLADGSRVVLNNGATLHYRRGLWGRTRSVILTGEAYFDVSPGTRPFTIETFNATVQVLGTTFTVRAWPEGDTPETALMVASGQVRFAPRIAEARADTLTTGQMSRVVAAATAPTPPPEPFNPDLATLWLEGGLAFIERPLSALFLELERRFGITIEVDPAVTTTDTLTWIQPRLQSAEAAIIDVCSHSGCGYEQTEAGFRIVGAPE